MNYPSFYWKKQRKRKLAKKLSLFSQYTEEELLLQLLKKKLDKGLIKSEFKKGKFLLSSKGTVIEVYDENNPKCFNMTKTKKPLAILPTNQRKCVILFLLLLGYLLYLFD
jgi:hypothetical protein